MLGVSSRRRRGDRWITHDAAVARSKARRLRISHTSPHHRMRCVLVMEAARSDKVFACTFGGLDARWIGACFTWRGQAWPACETYQTTLCQRPRKASNGADGGVDFWSRFLSL